MNKMASEDIKVKCDQACQAANDFSKLYYETFDKRRHVLSRLYMDTASLTWNGNSVTGISNILTFYDTLPSSEHTVESLDAHPIVEGTQGQSTILVCACGYVKYQGNCAGTFTQNFLLASMPGDVWKVVSDCYRSTEVDN
ncbi:NTF2-related export protein 1-like [Tubulanus polymorphus]|uniref:NTF2-related export protein 1-like n=1 Tax=Tubulanus polymorphus TaxID=672921 RepID=UPI003DA33598